MIKPINDFILLKEFDDYQEKVVGAVVLETSTSQEADSRLKRYEVIDISDGYINPHTDSTRTIDNNIKPGSIVIMDKYSGKKIIDEDGTEYILVREAEIQGIVKNKEEK